MNEVLRIGWWVGLLACLGVARGEGTAAALVAEGGVIYSVVAPEGAQAGGVVAVRVAAMNSGAASVQVEWPDTIEVRVVPTNGAETSVRATRRGTGETSSQIAAGAFALREYELPLAGGRAGTVVLDWGVGRTAMVIGPAQEASGRATISSRVATTEEAAGEPATRRPPTNLGRAPAGAGIQRTFADRLAPHEPIYFVYGPEAPAAKFQVSFKYKLLDFREVAPQRMARTLHVAYTQRSLWDLDGVSSPFYDTSYMPELMYEALAPRPEESDRWFTWLGVQAAFKHESNGRDGPVSRSLNMLYARPVFAFGNLDGWHLLAMPEVFAYVGTLEDNTDIEEYRGFGKLNLVLGRNDGPSLMATLWAGNDFQHPTVQLDLNVPIRTRLLNFETYLLVQYFNGYGESLLSYDKESESVRAGISLVR